MAEITTAALIPVEDLEQLEALQRERGLAALRSLQEASVRRGLNKLTDKAIEAEIQAARAARRHPQP